MIRSYPGNSQSGKLVSGRIVTVALALTILVGTAVGYVPPSPLSLITFCNALLLILMLRFCRAQRELDCFEPLAVAVLAFAFLFVIRPISIIRNQYTHYLGYNIESFYAEAAALSFVAILCFAVGYRSSLGVRWGRRIPAASSTIHLDTAIVSAVATFALGIALYAIFLAQSGGISALQIVLAGRSSSSTALTRDSTGYFYQGLLLSIPASGILLSTAFQSRKLWPAMIGGLMLVPISITSLASGGRTTLLMIAASLAVSGYLIRNRRPSWLSIVSFGYLGLTLFIASIGNSRNVLSEMSRLESALYYLVHPGAALDRLTAGGDGEMFDVLAIMMSFVPETLPFSPFATFTDPLIRFIPRPLWPGKPLESHDQFINTMLDGWFGVVRAGPASSFVGSLYLDSGLISVVGGMFIIGVALRSVWEWRALNHENPNVQLIYGFGTPFIIFLLRGNISGVLSIMIYTLFPLLILIIAAGRPLSSEPLVVTDRVVKRDV